MDSIFKNLNLDKLQNKITSVKNKIILSEIEQMLEEATSNEHCHANLSLLNDIADRAGGYADYQTIVNHIEKTIQLDKQKWRRLLKTLFLIEHLLRVGNNRFVTSLNSFSYKIKELKNFKYIDDKGDEKGGSIREKASFIIDLLEDSDKLDEEKKNYKEWKNRIAGVSNNGSTNGISSVSSSSITQSNYGGVSSSNYNHKKNEDRNRVGTNFNPDTFKKTEIKRNNIDSDEDNEDDKDNKYNKDNKDKDNDYNNRNNKEKQKRIINNKGNNDDEFEVVQEKNVNNNKKLNLKGNENKVVVDDEDFFCEVKEKNKNEIDIFGSSTIDDKSKNDKIDFFSFANTSENKENTFDFSANNSNNNKNEVNTEIQNLFISAPTNNHTHINNYPYQQFPQYPQYPQYNPYSNNYQYSQNQMNNNIYNTNYPISNNSNSASNQEKIKLNYSSFKKADDDNLFKTSTDSHNHNQNQNIKSGILLDSKFINLDDLGVGKKKN